MTSLAIVGGPRTGKTTFARAICDAFPVSRRPSLIRTDIIHDCLLASYEIYRRADHRQRWRFLGQEVVRTLRHWPGGSIVEGVVVATALKYALQRSDAKPVDRVLVMRTVRQPRAAHQESMAVGILSTFESIVDELRARGVEITEC